jgi:hypothetical protein
MFFVIFMGAVHHEAHEDDKVFLFEAAVALCAQHANCIAGKQRR